MAVMTGMPSTVTDTGTRLCPRSPDLEPLNPDVGAAVPSSCDLGEVTALETLRFPSLLSICPTASWKEGRGAPPAFLVRRRLGEVGISQAGGGLGEL